MCFSSPKMPSPAPPPAPPPPPPSPSAAMVQPKPSQVADYRQGRSQNRGKAALTIPLGGMGGGSGVGY
jgi:hypothetical protein